jgi:hypothetical protein
MIKNIQEIITLTEEEFEKCKTFAVDVNKTTSQHYSNLRGQTNNKKKEKDHLISKLAETGVHRFLVLHELPYQEPDFNIYENKKKSWDSDIVSLDKEQYRDIAVKSCYGDGKYKDSWTINYSDKRGYGGKDKVIFNPETPVVLFLASVFENERQVRIDYCLRGKSIHEHNLLKLPVVRQLWNYKRCLYMADLNEVQSDAISMKEVIVYG